MYLCNKQEELKDNQVELEALLESVEAAIKTYVKVSYESGIISTHKRLMARLFFLQNTRF